MKMTFLSGIGFATINAVRKRGLIIPSAGVRCYEIVGESAASTVLSDRSTTLLLL